MLSQASGQTPIQIKLENHKHLSKHQKGGLSGKPLEVHSNILIGSTQQAHNVQVQAPFSTQVIICLSDIICERL